MRGDLYNLSDAMPITTDIKGAMRLFGFGKNKMLEIANKANAKITINSRCKRYDVKAIEDYLKGLKNKSD
jgi:hypothetical protein